MAVADLPEEQPQDEASTLAQLLESSLAAKNWLIDAGIDAIGDRGPDFVATAPTGVNYFVEVKKGTGSAHFSQIARIGSLVSEFDEEHPASVPPRGVLLTNLAVPPKVREAAKAVGVQIVVAPDDTVVAMSDALVNFLDSSAGE